MATRITTSFHSWLTCNRRAQQGGDVGQTSTVQSTYAAELPGRLRDPSNPPSYNHTQPPSNRHPTALTSSTLLFSTLQHHPSNPSALITSNRCPNAIQAHALTSRTLLFPSCPAIPPIYPAPIASKRSCSPSNTLLSPTAQPPSPLTSSTLLFSTLQSRLPRFMAASKATRAMRSTSCSLQRVQQQQRQR